MWLPPQDFESLFAEMVRFGLQPSHNTYEIADLSIMLEKNEQIAKLSPDVIKDIAEAVHRERLLGSSDETITTLMTRRIQGAKLDLRDSLEKTTEKLRSEQRDNERTKGINRGLDNALRNRIDNEVRGEIKTSKRNWRIKRGISLVLFCVVFALFLYLFDIENVIMWIITEGLGLAIGYVVQRYIPIIGGRSSSNSEEEIEREIQRRLDAECSKGKDDPQ